MDRLGMEHCDMFALQVGRYPRHLISLFFRLLYPWYWPSSCSNFVVSCIKAVLYSIVRLIKAKAELNTFYILVKPAAISQSLCIECGFGHKRPHSKRTLPTIVLLSMENINSALRKIPQDSFLTCFVVIVKMLFCCRG